MQQTSGRNTRIKRGDRVRHIDLREGIVTEVLPDMEVIVDLENGGVHRSYMGYWENIYREKVTA